METLVIREEYDQEHNCITIQELRWILRHAKRHSAFYTACVLLASAGLRSDELLSLTLYNLSPDARTITYQVLKPKKDHDDGTLTITRKHRTVTLDPWVAGELRSYCDLHFSTIDAYGRKQYHSPYHDKVPNCRGLQQSQKLFPWKNTSVFDVLWYKLRHAMHKAGFDSFRLDTLTIRPDAEHKVHVVRAHQLRHFALTVYYYQHGCDLKAAQTWIKHSRSQTTDGYVHSAAQLGSTPDELRNLSYSHLFGFDDDAKPSDTGVTPQTTIDMF